MDSRLAPSSRQQILHHLKLEGPKTTAEIAALLGVTPVAARHHISVMEDRGHIKKQERRGARGRPACMWDLSSEGRRSLGDNHVDLAVRLLGAVEAVFGDTGLTRVLSVMGQRELSQAWDQIPAGPEMALQHRLEALVELRNTQGYMAELQKTADGWLLLEHHCPVEAAANSCGALCDQELDVFQVLLHGAKVERREHMVDGDRRCGYSVQVQGPEMSV